MNSRKGKIISSLMMKKDQMPVYYDSNQGNRYSLLSEMVQAQPQRNDNPFEEAEEDNPFGRQSSY